MQSFSYAAVLPYLELSRRLTIGRLPYYQVIGDDEIKHLENGALVLVKLKSGYQLNGQYVGIDHAVPSEPTTDSSHSDMSVKMRVLTADREVVVDTSQISSVEIQTSKRSVTGSVLTGVVIDVALIYVATSNIGLNIGTLSW